MQCAGVARGSATDILSAGSASAADAEPRQRGAEEGSCDAGEHEGEFDARMVLSYAGVADSGRSRDPSSGDEEPDGHQVRESKEPSHARTNPGAAARFLLKAGVECERARNRRASPHIPLWAP
jgi:hypothetical protein